MNDQPEDKNKKGFAGFDAFIDDLGVEVPKSNDTLAEGAKAPEAPKPVSPVAANNSFWGPFFPRKIQAAKIKFREHKSWIIILGGIGVIAIVAQMNDKPHAARPYSAPYTAPTSQSNASYGTTALDAEAPAACRY